MNQFRIKAHRLYRIPFRWLLVQRVFAIYFIHKKLMQIDFTKFAIILFKLVKLFLFY